MTTKASISYTKFKFKKMIQFYLEEKALESLKEVHDLVKDRLKIPMKNDMRSLNIASSVAIILAESLKQINLI